MTPIDSTPSEHTPPAESSGGHRVSLTDRVMRASVLVFAAHIFEKFFGLIQAKLLAQYYGVNSLESDVWALAFAGIIYPLFLIGEESLGPAFLPVFMGAKDRGREREAWVFARTVIVSYLAIILAICLAFVFWPHEILDTITQLNASASSHSVGQDVLDLSAQVFPVIIFGLVGLSVGSITYVILNGYKRFFLAAFGDSAFKIGLITAVIVMAKTFGIWALVVGVVVGGSLKLVVHLAGMPDKLKYLFKPAFDWGSPEFRKLMVLTAPLLFGILFARLRDYVINIFAISSLYGHSGNNWMSLNMFGKQIYNTVHRIIPYAISIAMYPYFVELIDRNDRKQLGEFMTSATRMILVILLPVSLSFAALMEPLSQLIFTGGKTSFATATDVGLINAVYVLVLGAMAAETFLLQGFFSNRKMLAPTVIGVIFSGIVMILSILICHPAFFGLKGMTAVLMLGVAFVTIRWLKTVTLVVWFKRHIKSFPVRPMLGFLVRLIIMSLILGAAVRWIDTLLATRMDTSKRATQLIRLAVGGSVSVVLYLAGCVIFKLDEFKTAVMYAMKKIWRETPDAHAPNDDHPTPPDTDASP